MKRQTDRKISEPVRRQNGPRDLNGRHQPNPLGDPRQCGWGCVHRCIACNEGSGEGWVLSKAVKRREQGGFFDTITKRVFGHLYARARASEDHRTCQTSMASADSA
jgi:hypothetical protein